LTKTHLTISYIAVLAANTLLRLSVIYWLTLSAQCEFLILLMQNA
jgi:hypothetical protein